MPMAGGISFVNISVGNIKVLIMCRLIDKKSVLKFKGIINEQLSKFNVYNNSILVR